MARAAVAAGADGLIIEVHGDPDHALSDGAQSLFPAQFDRLMAELRIIAPAIGRSICLEPVAQQGMGSLSRAALCTHRHRRPRADRRLDRAGRQAALAGGRRSSRVDRPSVVETARATAHRSTRGGERLDGRRRRGSRRAGRAGAAERRGAAASCRSTCRAARRHRRRQHEARDHRGGRARCPPRLRVHRRPSAGRRRGRRRRGRAPGPVRRPPVAPDAASAAARTRRCDALTAFVAGLGAVPQHHRRRSSTIGSSRTSATFRSLTVSALMHVVGEHAGAEGPRARRAAGCATPRGSRRARRALAGHRRHATRDNIAQRDRRADRRAAELKAAPTPERDGASSGCSCRPRGGRACSSTADDAAEPSARILEMRDRAALQPRDAAGSVGPRRAGARLPAVVLAVSLYRGRPRVSLGRSAAVDRRRDPRAISPIRRCRCG